MTRPVQSTGDFYLAHRMVALARAAVDEPGVAYLCLWTAFLHIVHARAPELGARAHFGLRKNGTLRTLKIGGRRGTASWKMPEVIPARETRQIDVVLAYMSDDLKDRLLRHAAVRYFVDRVPTLRGPPVLRDGYGQQPRGVLDIAATIDPRYPVWHPIDGEALRRHFAEADGSSKAGAEIRDLLLGQLAAVLQTIYANLLIAENMDGGDANQEVAAKALPLLKMLVTGLLAEAGDEERSGV